MTLGSNALTDFTGGTVNGRNLVPLGIVSSRSEKSALQPARIESRRIAQTGGRRSLSTNRHRPLRSRSRSSRGHENEL
jgi:hypothetical protein